MIPQAAAFRRSGSPRTTTVSLFKTSLSAYLRQGPADPQGAVREAVVRERGFTVLPDTS